MIVYDFVCLCGYTFEGWFENREDFQVQQQGLLLICPSCGGNKVGKILSPVRTNKSVNGLSRVERSQPGPEESGCQSTEEKILKAVQNYVTANYEDVGTGLASEALKIRYGVKEPRNIRGVATEAEEQTLKKEGIGLLKIPMPVKDEPTN